MKKLFYALISILICCISFSFFFQRIVTAEDQNIEILLAGVDSEPLSIKIGDLESKNNTIELWHHSGKYWSYKGIQIRDEIFGDELGNEHKLEEAINEEITFEIPLDQNLYNKLINNKKIKIYCSSILTTQKTNSNIPIAKLFYDRPIIEIKENKLFFKAKPKLHFYTKDNINFSKIIGDTLNVNIPIVDPDYGHNSYAIWKRTAKNDLGATDSYFDKDDPYAWAPA
ncbi:MAG: hypothetical protein GX270_01035, partial [Clostridiaceae bacterium]|nr:hypothetical protein [Clostridiaceae bacterium]